MDQLRSRRKRIRSIGRLATVMIAGNELIRMLQGAWKGSAHDDSNTSVLRVCRNVVCRVVIVDDPGGDAGLGLQADKHACVRKLQMTAWADTALEAAHAKPRLYRLSEEFSASRTRLRAVSRCAQLARVGRQTRRSSGTILIHAAQV